MRTRRGRRTFGWGLALAGTVLVAAAYVSCDRLLVWSRLCLPPRTIFDVLVAPGVSENEMLERSRAAIAQTMLSAHTADSEDGAGIEALSAEGDLAAVPSTPFQGFRLGSSSR